jgi:hypothetical protein
MKFSNCSRHRRRGSILPLVAGGITALLMATALAVDYSVMLSDKNQLQRACDAGCSGRGRLSSALIGSTASRTEAKNQALLIAKQNYLTPTEMTAREHHFSQRQQHQNSRRRLARASALFRPRTGRRAGKYNGVCNGGGQSQRGDSGAYRHHHSLQRYLPKQR